MPTLVDHEIEGTLNVSDDTPLKQCKFVVHALVNGDEVATGTVSPSGQYKVRFQHELEKPTTELRVTANGDIEGSGEIAAAELLTPASFSTEKNLAVAHRDMDLASGALKRLPGWYLLFGQVFLKTGYIIEPLPRARLDFDVVIPEVVLSTSGGPPRTSYHKEHLAQCFTRADGTYSVSGFADISGVSSILTKEKPFTLLRIEELREEDFWELLSERIDGLPYGRHLDFVVERKTPSCFDFSNEAPGASPNPLLSGRFTFTVFDKTGQQMSGSVIRAINPSMAGSSRGLDCGSKLTIGFGCPSNRIRLTLFWSAASCTAEGLDSNDNVVATGVVNKDEPNALRLVSKSPMTKVTLSCPGNEKILVKLCS